MIYFILGFITGAVVVRVFTKHDRPRNNLIAKQEDRKDFLNKFKKQARLNKNLLKIGREVAAFASKFPVPGIN